MLINDSEGPSAARPPHSTARMREVNAFKSLITKTWAFHTNVRQRTNMGGIGNGYIVN